MTLPVLHGCKGLSNDIKGKLLAFVCPVMFSFSGLFVKSIPWPWQYLLAIRGIIAGVTIYFFMQISQLRFTVNRSSLLIGITVFATNILYFPAQRSRHIFAIHVPCVFDADVYGILSHTIHFQGFCIGTVIFNRHGFYISGCKFLHHAW